MTVIDQQVINIQVINISRLENPIEQRRKGELLVGTMLIRQMTHHRQKGFYTPDRIQLPRLTCSKMK